MSAAHRRRSDCRGCGAASLRRFLSLGPTPLANSFLRSEHDFATEPSFPLDVYFCPSCTLVQLVDVIDSDVLFRDYIYVTGTSETIAAHNRAYADAVATELGLTPSDLVVEVASNDGSLVKCFQDLGTHTLGIEPARNIAEVARSRGIETLAEFFTAELATQVRDTHGAARAVIANNVLAHVDDTVDFLTGCARLVADDGLVVIEVPYLGELIDRLEYDTVYHEHLCYFSVTALMKVLARAGLALVRVDHVPVHGGSLRLYARRSAPGDHASEVRDLAAREREAGLADYVTYERFAARVAENRERVREMLVRLSSSGADLAGYGAPAKGNTLLNYCGIGVDLLEFTVDRNPLKVGTFTPGMHLPVLAVDELTRRRPDYAMILAWNFAEEIVRQQDEYRRLGGRFIVPIPEPRMLRA